MERRNVSILMLDSEGSQEVVRWDLTNAWPSDGEERPSTPSIARWRSRACRSSSRPSKGASGMLRGPIRVLLGLVDRAARAWVRWRGGGVPGASVGDGPMQTSQAPADWVERVRRGAPGLLEPTDDDHIQVSPGAPDSRPKDMGELPDPHRIASVRDAKPPSPSAAPKPSAAPRPSPFEVSPPRRRPGKRPAAGDPGQSPASPGEGVGPPAADDLQPGRPHTSQPQPSGPDRVILLEPSAKPVRPPASTDSPAADSTPVNSQKKTEPLSPVQPAPTQFSAPISTEAAPRSIDRSHSGAGQPARSAKARRPSERLAEERSDSDSYRWPDLPDPPEEGEHDVQAALRKMERDRQVAREHSRL